MNNEILRSYIRVMIQEAIRSKKDPTVKWRGSAKFDMKEFKSLPNESIMFAYALNYLEPLGQGSSRTVFVLTSKKVLKLARNPKGVAQNQAEIQVYTDPATADAAAKIHDADEGGLWLISDMVRPVKSQQEFETLTGVSWQEFSDDLSGTISSQARKSGGAKLRPDAAPFTRSVYNMAEQGSARLKLGDLTELDHWGKTPDGRVVILDYGFTEDVAVKHYPKETPVVEPASAGTAVGGKAKQLPPSQAGTRKR